MATRLTKKEKGFVKDYLKTGNGTTAVLNNYDTDNKNAAAAIASENLTKPKILSALEEAFPDSELFKLHREGLYDDDLYVRHKYLDTAYKMKGSYAPEKTENKSVNLSLNIDMTKAEQIRHEYESKLKQTLNEEEPEQA